MIYNNVIEILKYQFYFDEKEVRSKPGKADWFEISRHLHELPIDFIREFRDRIQWERVDFKKFKSTEFNKEAEKRINLFNELTQNNSTLFSFIFELQLDNKDREIIIDLSK